MKGRKHRRATWIRLAIAVAVAIAAHALHAGSASAATSAIAAGPADTTGGPAIVLAGFTSQRFTTFFKVSPDGRVLVVGGITIALSCTSGTKIVVPDEFARVPIAADGRLHTSYTTPSTAGPDGSTYAGSDTLTARLGPEHSELAGTWRLQVHVTAAGGESEGCDSGRVRFTATG